MTQISSVASRVIEKFGGVKQFAAALEITEVSAYRMTYPRERGGTGGIIPQRHYEKLFKAARDREIPLTPSDLIDVGDAA